MPTHFHLHRSRGPAQMLLLGLSLLVATPTRVFASEATDRAALEAAVQAWASAFNASDAEALAACTTEDVVLLDATSSAVSGREAALGAWQKATLAAKVQLTTTTQEAVIVDHIAWRIGATTHTLATGDVAGRSQSLEIWKRAGGAWKLHRQMSASILPPAKVLTRPRPTEPVLDKPRN